MTDDQTRAVRRRLDDELSLEAFEHDRRPTEEAATQFFQDLFVQILDFEDAPSALGDATWRDLPVHEWPSSARANAARLFAAAGDFRVVYVELEQSTRTAQRNAIQGLARSDQTSRWAIDGSFLAVFHAEDEDVWHLVTPYDEGTDDVTTGRPVLRRYRLGEGETHRTAAGGLASMDASNGRLAERIDEAFRVERITEDFCANYKGAFGTLSDELQRKGLEIEDADRYAHIVLNRLLFFYYFQKSGWIAERKDFVRWYHQRYEESNDDGQFHEKWLSALFFGGTNRHEDDAIDASLPNDVQSAIAELPHMNGGLFQPTEEDDGDAYLSDSVLQSVVEDFLEQYNFTVSEESPYDVDVAVDPAMLGEIYESLIAERERGEAGIFYTPRGEVDLMCRAAVYEQLVDRLAIDRDTATRLIFTTRAEFRDDELSARTVEDVKDALQDLDIVDPACGSGAFLVGMLYVLAEIYNKTGTEVNYALKKRIVNQNIRGVDVKAWAVRVAEFRLWLSLVDDADVPDTRPVLPNFGLNLRVGDSIVQGSGDGVSLDSLDRSPSDVVRRKLPELQRQKLAFYRGDATDSHEIRETQRDLISRHVEQLLEELKENSRHSALTDGVAEDTDRSSREHRIDRLEEVKGKLASESGAFFWDVDFAEVMLEGGFDIVVGNPPYVEQSEIVPRHDSRSRLDTFDDDQKAELREEYKAGLREYVERSFDHSPPKSSDLYVFFFYRGLDVLKDGGTLTYVTSNSWLDVQYGSDLQGELLEESTVEYVLDNRNQRTFEEADVNTVISVLERNSSGFDGVTSFVAFYQPYASCVEPELIGDVFRGTPSGTRYRLHFAGERLDITINDYFRDLQIAQPDLWRLGSRDLSRVWPLDSDAPTPVTPSGSYSGGKWGRFLRAPDIYFKVLNDARDQLTTVGELADIERGFTTGANKFFYLPKPGTENRHFEGEFDAGTGALLLTPKDNERRTRFEDQGFDVGDPMFRIEKEYWMHEVEASEVPETSMQYESDGRLWVPNYVVKSPKEIETLSIDPESLSFVVLLVDERRNALQDGVLDYIEWGERYVPKRYGAYAERNTCAARNLWYRLDPKQANIFWIKSTNEEHYTPFSKLPLYVDQRMYLLEPDADLDYPLAAVMNSHLVSLVKEVEGRVNLGEGVLDTAVYEVPEYPVVDVSALSADQQDTLTERILGREFDVTDVWEELGADEYDRVDLDGVRSERNELDSILLTDILGLSSEDQRSVYEGLLRLVHERLSNAQSV